jgi:hypothetical protein
LSTYNKALVIIPVDTLYCHCYKFHSKGLVALKKEKKREERKKQPSPSQRVSKFPNKGRYVIPKGASVEVDPHHLLPLIHPLITIFHITQSIPLIHMHI